MPQKPVHAGRVCGTGGEAVSGAVTRVETPTAERNNGRLGTDGGQQSLMELAVERQNCLAAARDA